MAELRTLGALELLGKGGQPIDAVLSRQRRAALLVYLAIEAPSGFVRREPLLAMFWPEMDATRGRAALRQALYVLRSEAGEDLIITRGADEVGVSPDVTCDAATFDQLIASGDRAQALALYKGPFLHGFFISDAPEFERWVDERRETLRRKALMCAKSLADDHLAKDDNDAAIRALRTAMALEPSDEQAMTKLLAALEASGDRAAVLREYDAFAQTLANEYNLDPSPETRAIADAIRGTPRESEAVPVAEAEGTSPLTPTGKPHQSGERRTRMWPIGVAAVLVGLVVGVFAMSRPRENTADEPRLVVIPFAVRGAAHLSYLGDGMADMLSTSLYGPELFRSVPTTVVLGDVRARGTALDDVTKLRLTARRFGAQHMIVGSVVSAEGRLRLDSRLYGEGDEPLVLATVTGDPDSLFLLVDQLATQLIAGSLGSAPAKRMQASAALTTRSLAALRDYLQGERALRDGDFGTAQAFLRKAVAVDSTFALAYYRLSLALEWLGDPVAAREVAGIAERHAARLSVRDRSLLAAHAHMVRGHPDEAELRFRDILAESPDDPEAWLKLGEVLFHSNPIRGRNMREARDPFFRVLSYDPSHREALLHLARIAAVGGDVAELDSLETRLKARSDDAAALGIRAMAASLHRDRTAMAAVVRRAMTAPDLEVVDAARLTFVYTTNPVDALEIMAANLGPNRTEERRALTHLHMAVIELARGRSRAGRAHFAAAASVLPTVARNLEVFYALRSPIPLSRDDLEKMKAQLATSHTSRPIRGRGMNLPASIIDVDPQIRLALLSEVSARLGDSVAAARLGAELEALRSGAPWSRSLVLDEWRARRNIAAGHGARALADLSSHPVRDPEGNTLGFPWVAGLRLARAGALEQTGQLREAVVQYSSFDYQSVFFSPLVGPGLLRAAELLERLGDRSGARANYERVIVLWADAEPEYRQLVDTAKARRDALR
jgi:DNA-binding SARP family transcriptional activator/Flp pilus assembly protein TadD/TolB-like protein